MRRYALHDSLASLVMFLNPAAWTDSRSRDAIYTELDDFYKHCVGWDDVDLFLEYENMEERFKNRAALAVRRE